MRILSSEIAVLPLTVYNYHFVTSTFFIRDRKSNPCELSGLVQIFRTHMINLLVLVLQSLYEQSNKVVVEWTVNGGTKKLLDFIK